MSIPLMGAIALGQLSHWARIVQGLIVSLGWLNTPYFAVRASWDLGNAKSPLPTGAIFALLLVWDTGKGECGWKEPPLGTQAALEEQVVDILLPPQLSILEPCAPADPPNSS